MSSLVIHTEASRGWGGQETRVLTELKWLKSAGYRPMLVAPGDSQIFARASELGVECRAFEFSKWGQPVDFFKLWGIFRQLAPRVVATHSTIDSRIGLVAAKFAGVPIKLRYRHVSVPVTNTPLNRFVYGYCADKVITTADFISRELSRTLRLPASHFCTIATGIEPPAQMLDREAARARLAQKLSLPADSRFIGIVAVLRSWKGHLYLLDAFEKIAKAFPNYHLVLVGDGPMERMLRDRARELASAPRIHFVGFQHGVYDYFRAFDLSVLPSYAGEGIPQTVLQSFFAGTPVVGTSVGGIPEVVENGVTGLICEPSSPESLALALSEALRNPEAAFARAETALTRAQQNHTIAAMGRQLTALIGQP